jgi:hypothetical protein
MKTLCDRTVLLALIGVVAVAIAPAPREALAHALSFSESELFRHFPSGHHQHTCVFGVEPVLTTSQTIRSSSCLKEG